MFSNNRKISIRQIRRLLILDLFGVSTLLLPRILAGGMGVDGVFAIVAATVITLGYIWLLGNVLKRIQGDYGTWIKQLLGSLGADILLLFYLFFFLLLAAFVLYQLTGLVRDWLVPDSSYWLVSLLMLLLAGYATLRGLEGRARIYEILFWFLGIPLIIMLILALGTVDYNAWTPVAVTSPGAFGQGILAVCVFFLPVFFLLFLKPFCAVPKKLSGCACRALLVAAALNIAIYLILLGNFQVQATGALERPVITLMSMVRLPGGFFARLDAFMTAVWFFSMFALMNTGVFYGSHVLKGLFGEKKTHYGLLVVLILVFLTAQWFHGYPEAEQVYQMYLTHLGLPILTVIPILLWIFSFLKGKWKRKKPALLSILLLCLCCTGCGGRQLEERGFPLALAVDQEEEELVVSFEFPDLSASAEGKNPSGASVSFSVEAGAYYEAQKAYENNTNRSLDYNHLKAVILGKELLEDPEALRELLAWLEDREEIARNICLFGADPQGAQILTLTQETNGSVGKYLETMIENQKDFKQNKSMTLGKLMNQWHNQNELLLIPVLTDQGGVPSITEYAVVDRFLYKGTISVEEAMEVCLCQNFIETFTFRLETGEVLELSSLETQIDIMGDSEPMVKMKITGEAVLEKEGELGMAASGVIEKQLNQQLQRKLQKMTAELLQEQQVDASNSYYVLGGLNRQLYQRFQDQPEEYLKELNHEIFVKIRLVNE